MPAFDPDAFDFGAFDTESPIAPTTDNLEQSAATHGSGYSFVPSALLRAGLGLGAHTFADGQDRLLDPVTHDYVRTANGEWVETQDSRTIFLIAMQVWLGEGIFDPDHGSSVASRMVAGSLTSPEFLQAETVRVGTALANEGILSDLVVTVRDADRNPFFDEDGRLIVKATWRDLGSGAFVNATFATG